MEQGNLYRDLLLFSNLYPNRTAIKKKFYRLTYRKLINKIDTVSSYLYSLGLKKGNSIFIVSEYKKENLILFYASIKLGLDIKEIDRKEKYLIGTFKNNNKMICIIKNKQFFCSNCIYIKWKRMFLSSNNYYLPILNGKNEIGFFNLAHNKLIIGKKSCFSAKYYY